MVRYKSPSLIRQYTNENRIKSLYLMGTNYYIRIDNNNRDSDVHIGKSSGGWQFIFQTNPTYYHADKNSVNRFLKLHKDNLFDEYGINISIDNFWKLVEEKKEGLTLREYYRYPECLNFYSYAGRKLPKSELQNSELVDEIYTRLPAELEFLERFMKDEFFVDGIVFHDTEFC